MFGKSIFVITTTLFVVLTTLGCNQNQNRQQAPTNSFTGYWMVSEPLKLVSQAITDESCTLILVQKDLHPTNEIIDLPIISTWGDGSVFAVDSLIKEGAVAASPHPESVTANNLPGRFVLQGRFFAEGTFTPAENNGFTLAPFEAKEFKEQLMTFSLDESDVLVLEIKPKPTEAEVKQDEASEGDDNSDEVTADGEGVQEEVEPFRLIYNRINLQQYRGMMNFSQTCLDQAE